MEELDIAVLNLEDESEQERLRAVLKRTVGVEAARIIDEGVWIRYDPQRATGEYLVRKLADAYFEARLFEDSYSHTASEVSQT